jgi:hypothetical protein
LVRILPLGVKAFICWFDAKGISEKPVLSIVVPIQTMRIEFALNNQMLEISPDENKDNQGL